MALPEPEEGESVNAYFTRVRSALNRCGDTLFAFVIRELCDCGDDPQDCIERLERAQADLEGVASAIYKLTGD